MPLPDIFVPQPGVEKHTLSRTVVITSYPIETNLQVIENEAERQPDYKMKRTQLKDHHQSVHENKARLNIHGLNT